MDDITESDIKTTCDVLEQMKEDFEEDGLEEADNVKDTQHYVYYYADQYMD